MNVAYLQQKGRIMKKLFLILCVLVLTTPLLGGVWVPESELPSGCSWPGCQGGHIWDPVKCVLSTKYARFDSAVIETDTGTPDVVIGSGIDCEHCSCGCLNNPPSPPPGEADCDIEVGFSVSHTVTKSISYGVGVEKDDIEDAFDLEVSWENGKEVTLNAACGVTHDGCTTLRREVYLNIAEDAVFTVNSNYYVYHRWFHNIGYTCDCATETYEACFHGDVCGPDTSTMTATYPTGDATCRTRQHPDDPDGDCTGPTLVYD